jgi:DNA recombination protein RmuC
MEIALIVIVVFLLAASAGLAWFAMRARVAALATAAQLAAIRRGDDDWERLRQENIVAVGAAAEAASLRAAQAVSNKLLDDHKRESEAAAKASEERVRVTSETLVRQVGDVVRAVAGLQTQVKESNDTVDLIKRVLENPGSAGAMTEIVLDNTLKAFGLETPRDYVLQHTTEDDESGKRLRPDAVVFLPGGTALVVDCKASKFLLDIARADGTDGEVAAYANFSRTMNQHLRALTDKDYRSAILAARREVGLGEPPRQIHMMMFLPSDAAMAKLTHADPAFRERARAANILVGGPDVLHCALSLASAEIRMARQVENHEKIIDRTIHLLDGIAVALAKADGVGDSIKRAAKQFDEFSRSVNKTLLPRARILVTLGIQPNKPVPAPLPVFTVQSEDRIIEGQAEELELPEPAPRLVK